MKHTYRIEIDCANCARKVEAAINELPEVESAVLSYVNKTLVIEVENELEVEYPEIEKMIMDTAKSVESDFEMWSDEDRPKRTATRYEYDIEIDASIPLVLQVSRNWSCSSRFLPSSACW